MTNAREIEYKAQLAHERDVNDTLRTILDAVRGQRDLLQRELDRHLIRIDQFTVTAATEAERVLVRVFGNVPSGHGELDVL